MGNTLPNITLILGGARSGKSQLAEDMIESAGGGTYLATAQAFDSEMTERIARHKARRDNLWTTYEEPLELIGSLSKLDGPVLIDCLTLWVSNLMLAEKDIEAESQALCSWLEKATGPYVFVSNEVGLGIVPENKMARDFRDHAGRLHQDLAKVANKVVFVAAGLPLTLKDQP